VSTVGGAAQFDAGTSTLDSPLATPEDITFDICHDFSMSSCDSKTFIGALATPDSSVDGDDFVLNDSASIPHHSAIDLFDINDFFDDSLPVGTDLTSNSNTAAEQIHDLSVFDTENQDS